LPEPPITTPRLPGSAATSSCSADDSSGEAPDDPPSSSSGGADQGPYQPTDDDRAEIRDLLETRARALDDEDEQAFLATVDPGNGDLVAAQRTLFHNITQLPVASVDYLVEDASGLPPADVDGGDPVFRPFVIERLELEGIDEAPVGNTLEDTFVKRADGWVLGAETLAGDYPEGEEPQSWPWGGGVPIVGARVDDLLVLVDREDREQAPDLAQAVAGDIDDDAEVLGVEPRTDVLVDATTSGSVRMMNTLDDSEAAAVTFPVYALDEDGRASEFGGMRIKINPEQIDAYAADDFVLKHELSHFLMARHAGAWPTWLSEGLADYTATQPLSFAQGPAGVDSSYLDGLRRDLPTKAKWGLDPQADYLIARAAVTYLADTYGVPKVLQLGRAYEKAYDGGDADQLTARVLPKTLGLTEADLVRETWALLDTLG
jgi:hypothetical protein